MSYAEALAQQTRGIGVYPGRNSESYAPILRHNDTYRNVALRRLVTQSSSFDFNLTAHLLTDGIISSDMPARLEVSTPQGEVGLRERESTLDGNDWTSTVVKGADTWLQYDWSEMEIEADEVVLTGYLAHRDVSPDAIYNIRCSVSSDGKLWKTVATTSGSGLPGTPARGKANADPNKNGGGELIPASNIKMPLKFKKAVRFSHLRIELQATDAVYWVLSDVSILKNDNSQNGNKSSSPVLLPSSKFISAWMTAGKGTEWACIDLGSQAEINSINLHWLKTSWKGCVQLSVDGNEWETVYTWTNGKADSKISLKASARYVRLMAEAREDGDICALTEIEVWGCGGLSVAPVLRDSLSEDAVSLNGNNWHLCRKSEIGATGEQLSRSGFDDSSWLTATVPATVLVSYLNAGAIPNPNFDDNLLQISESFFNSNFWYRRTFEVPEQMEGRRVMLCFDGINWKASVFVNGKRVGDIAGAFVRGHFDITPYLAKGTNVLAVEIVKPDNPGAVKLKNEISTDYNGGILGADNPTFHATVGWDWISTIRGRNIGIWNDVYLKAVDNVEISDPYVATSMTWPDTLVTLTPSVFVKNHLEKAVSGTLRGRIGDVEFSREITLSPFEEKEVSFLPEDFPQLRNRNMRLWWPNGYGEPYLHDASYEFVNSNPILGRGREKLLYKAGLRQIEYEDAATNLKIWVNGKRFIPRGGNWGFSEHNLCYRKREYDAAVSYHRDMNMNIIRNWVGQTADEEFYAACDSLGIMVWQDFWLANPSDGPDPKDERMFMDNARDYVRRIRNHASIALYCGRNEGYPPKSLDSGLRQLVKDLSPTLLYISSSADEGVSGHGPYSFMPPKDYFKTPNDKLHTERGMPCMMTFEGLQRTFRPENLWPQNNVWGQHDFTLEGAQRGSTFNKEMERRFGEINDVNEYAHLAQWINYDGYRAMYESSNLKRQGMIIWMSHPCWPSLTWQTYDYYLEPTAAFFGVKKACEPVHVQWDENSGWIDIVNNSGGTRNLILCKEILDITGKVVSKDSVEVSSHNDETRHWAPVEFPDEMFMYLLRLYLYDAGTHELVSENSYVRSVDGSYRQFLMVPHTELESISLRKGNSMTVKVENTGNTPAYFVRVMLVNSNGEQVLPVHYSDNYFHIMPHEVRNITITFNEEDLKGRPTIMLDFCNK